MVAEKGAGAGANAGRVATEIGTVHMSIGARGSGLAATTTAAVDAAALPLKKVVSINASTLSGMLVG